MDSCSVFGFASMRMEDCSLCVWILGLSMVGFFCLNLWARWMDDMRQTQLTPLSIMMDHFKDVRERAAKLDVEVRRDRWQAFCSSEWPTFQVGWPSGGTYDLPTIRRVKGVISRPNQGHPDQLPYIDTWQDLVETPPSWLKPFLPPSPPPDPVLALQETKKKEEDRRYTQPSAPPYLVLQGGTEEELIFPPPYEPPRGLQRAEPPMLGGGAPGMLGGGAPGMLGGGAPGVVAVPVPVGSPPLTRQRAQRELLTIAPDFTIATLPLRVAGPPDPDGDQPHHYWPFATSDLYNWKNHNPKFSEKPARLIDLLDSVLFTHQPTWDDCQQLLQILFTTEERERILNDARKVVPGADGNPTSNPVQIELSFPLTRPEWDFNTAEGKERLRVYRQTLMGGLRMAARQPTNLAKVGNVMQERDESPAAFLERIMEAYRTYTPMNPQAPDNKVAVIMSFINQSATDIKRKLQRVEKLGDRSLQDLLAVAEKVYNNRESPEDRQTRAVAAASSRQARDMARVLLATTADSLGEREHRLRQLVDDRGRGKRITQEGRWRPRKDQCRFCKETGHWSRECPKKAGERGDRMSRVKVLEMDELSD